MARKVGQIIDRMMSDNGDPMEVAELVKRQEAESRIIEKLMTSLRLTPQSYEPPRVSHKKMRQTATPWNAVEDR